MCVHCVTCVSTDFRVLKYPIHKYFDNLLLSDTETLLEHSFSFGSIRNWDRHMKAVIEGTEYNNKSIIKYKKKHYV